MTYDVVLVLLIWASILIVVLFVDFSSNKKAKPYTIYMMIKASPLALLMIW